MSTLTLRAARARYLTLHGLRWLPTGLLLPVFVLFMLERGLSLAQIGSVFAIQGLVVLALELPTGGLADALGRKPVLVGAALTNLVSMALFAAAHSIAVFAVAILLQGIYRALESGPLDAWYVDAMLAADPEADVERGLSGAGVVAGLSIAAGALLSGGLVALGSIGGLSALTGPVVIAIALQALGILALVVLLVEERPAAGAGALRRSVRAVPGVIGGALGLLRRSRVVLALVSVELFWGFGMATFETLMPVRLSDVVGDADRAAALLGPANSAAWLVSAAGAAAATVVSRRIGVAPAAGLFRVLQGAAVVGMALLAGPAGVIAAFLGCYLVHGASNPLHMGLLHRQVDGPYRTSVVSVNSMIAQAAGAIGLIVLTALAGASSVTVAMLVGAGVLAAAAPLYIPAWRQANGSAPATAPVGTPADGPTVGPEGLSA